MPRPATLEDLGAVLGNTESIINAAHKNYVLHSHLPRFWEAFGKKLHEVTGIAIPKDEREQVAIVDKETGEVSYPDVTPSVYFKAVQAAEGKEPSAYQALAQEVMDSIDYDPTAKSAASKPKKLFLDSAKELVAKITAAGGDFSKSLAYFKAELGDAVVGGEGGSFTEEEFAWNLQKIRENQERAQADNFGV